MLLIQWLSLCELCVVFFLVLLCGELCPFYFCNHFDGKEKAGCCFTLIVFLVSCDCRFPVALPRDDRG